VAHIKAWVIACGLLALSALGYVEVFLDRSQRIVGGTLLLRGQIMALIHMLRGEWPVKPIIVSAKLVDRCGETYVHMNVSFLVTGIGNTATVQKIAVLWKHDDEEWQSVAYLADNSGSKIATPLTVTTNGREGTGLEIRCSLRQTASPVAVKLKLIRPNFKII